MDITSAITCQDLASVWHACVESDLSIARSAVIRGHIATEHNHLCGAIEAQAESAWWSAEARKHMEIEP